MLLALLAHGLVRKEAETPLAAHQEAIAQQAASQLLLPDTPKKCVLGHKRGQGALVDVTASAVFEEATAAEITDSCGMYESDWEPFTNMFSNPAGADPYTAPKHFYNATLPSCRGKKTNVLWLYPQEDHNDAYGMESSVCKRLLGWHEISCSVHVWRVGSVQQAIDVVSDYDHDSLMAVVIGGHGDAGGPMLQWGPGNDCGESWLCGEGDSSEAQGAGRTRLAQRSMSFIKDALKPRLANHATVFLDSCYGAANGFVQIFADTIGKGVRVIGGDNSFSTVTVARYGAGHTLAGLKGAHVAVVDAGGSECPDWAAHGTPDKDGDCECSGGQECTVDGGGRCLFSDGKLGWAVVDPKYFHPGCATYGTCRCA